MQSINAHNNKFSTSIFKNDTLARQNAFSSSLSVCYRSFHQWKKPYACAETLAGTRSLRRRTYRRLKLQWRRKRLYYSNPMASTLVKDEGLSIHPERANYTSPMATPWVKNARRFLRPERAT